MSAPRPDDPVARFWARNRPLIILGLIVFVVVVVLAIAFTHSGGGVGSS